MTTRVIHDEATQRPATHIAARMARWSARHRKIAVFGWLGFVVAAFAIGTAVGTQTIDLDTAGPGESGRVDKLLAAGFEQPAGESVLVQSSSLQADDPAFEAAIDDVVAALVLQDAVTKIRSPLVTENAGQISEDGRSALVEYQIRGDSDKAADLIDPVTASIEKVQSAHPELFVGGFGLLISGFVAYGLWRGGRRGSQILALVFSAFLIGQMPS